MAVDPTYPLVPIASLICSALLFFALTVKLLYQRESWNLGVIALCFWLAVDNLIKGINAIIWSDNAQIKAYVYCDIGLSFDDFDHLSGRLILFVL
jgi:hypothetical protein